MERKRVEFVVTKAGRNDFYGEAHSSVVSTDGKLHIQLCIADVTTTKISEVKLAREVLATKKVSVHVAEFTNQSAFYVQRPELCAVFYFDERRC
jgi:hypothetical protein